MPARTHSDAYACLNFLVERSRRDSHSSLRSQAWAVEQRLSLRSDPGCACSTLRQYDTLVAHRAHRRGKTRAVLLSSRDSDLPLWMERERGCSSRTPDLGADASRRPPRHAHRGLEGAHGSASTRRHQAAMSLGTAGHPSTPPPHVTLTLLLPGRGVCEIIHAPRCHRAPPSGCGFCGNPAGGW